MGLIEFDEATKTWNDTSAKKLMPSALHCRSASSTFQISQQPRELVGFTRFNYQLEELGDEIVIAIINPMKEIACQLSETK